MALHTRINILSLCSGIGGLDIGVHNALRRIGFDPRTVCYVEIETYAGAVLAARMEEGGLDEAPIWTDLKTFPVEMFRDRIDMVIGGYPCQPFSCAGQRRGVEDERHLWPHIFGIVAAIRPLWCFFENVSGHLTLGFRDVVADLQSLGYVVEGGLFKASEVGAPHRRERLFILAYGADDRCGMEIAGVGPEEQSGGRLLSRDSIAGCSRELAHGEYARFIERGETYDTDQCDASWNDTDGCDENMADTEVSRWRESESRRQSEGRTASGWTGGNVADSAGPRRDREAGQGIHEGGQTLPAARSADDDRELGHAERSRRAATGTGSDLKSGTESAVGSRIVGDSTSKHLGFDSNRAGQSEERRRDSGSAGGHIPAWPPSPSDTLGWQRILRLRPDLAPALAHAPRKPTHRSKAGITDGDGTGSSDAPRGRFKPDSRSATSSQDRSERQQEESESEIRGMADGIPYRMDGDE